MKVTPQFFEPEYVVDRQPYRLRIEGKDGQAMEIVEQMGGGFSIVACSRINSNLVITPLGANSIIVLDKP